VALKLCCATGERLATASVAPMSWALWLAPPLVVTVLASLWAWVRNRPVPAPATDEAIKAHQDYLDALVVPARGTARVERS
jgi:hypothetical protein